MILREFKEFAMRGNVIDLAVGIIIGAAFGPIAQSLADDIIMPPIGMLLSRVDFANLFILLQEGPAASAPYASLAEAQAAGAVTINYGLFINNIVSFIITAFAVFLLVRFINRLRRQEDNIQPEEPTTKSCPYCYSKISIKAARCAFCTSELPAGEKVESKASVPA
jgi:large conductance mechanosensitive channel